MTVHALPAARALVPTPAPTVAGVRAMMQQARADAFALAADTAASADALAAQSRELATLADALPVGVVENARQLAGELETRAASLRLLIGRAGGKAPHVAESAS